MSVRKSSHGTIFLIVSSGSPRALIASSLRSTSKKPFCPMTRPLHPPMTAHGHRVRFVATWREEFFEVPNLSSVGESVRLPLGVRDGCSAHEVRAPLSFLFLRVVLAARRVGARMESAIL